MQQNVLKVIMNTYYGVSGYTRFGSSTGRSGLRSPPWAGRSSSTPGAIIEQQGYKVIYGDTDSCMVQIPPLDREKTIETARSLKNSSMRVTRSLPGAS